MEGVKRAAIYVRVSTSKKINPDVYHQNPQVQEAPLRELAERRGWTVYKIYCDRMSGANPNRPEYRRLMEDARRRAFDVVMVWKLDRFARSVKELLTGLDEFNSLGIDFVSSTEAMDTSTPAGRLLFAVIGAIAEFERSLIRERIRAGVEYARENGTKSGNTIGRQRKVFNRDLAISLRTQGVSIREIARRLGVGKGTVERACPVTIKPGGPRKPSDTKRLGKAS
jgi:DNA invertase Pin-like site-specific DNA recombinase